MLAVERLEISVEERNTLSISRIPPLPTKRNLKRDTF